VSAAPQHCDIQSALRFVRMAREDADLSTQLRELDPEDGLGPVLELAARMGYVLRVEELRAAHRIDWGLRRARYWPSTRPSAASTVAVVNSASSSR
jgi:hypothetical protein